MSVAKNVWKDIEKIRKQQPLIHNITNYVVMNNTANALLALGASPVMAHAIEELDEMIQMAGALVLNIGTLDNQWISSMYGALNASRKYGTPIVLDPVGAGATKLRTQSVAHLLDKRRPDIICGNGSEIIAVAGIDQETKGVDSLKSSDDAVEAGEILAQKFETTVVISGKTDHIISQDKKVQVKNGNAMMGRITGMGCTCSALAGAFLSVNDDSFAASVNTMVCLGIAGEVAAEKATGPGSLQMYILDALYNLDQESIVNRIKIE